MATPVAKAVASIESRTDRRCDIALMGIGTAQDPAFSSLYQGGHITLETLDQLRQDGAVGEAADGSVEELDLSDLEEVLDDDYELVDEEEEEEPHREHGQIGRKV